MVPYRFNLLEKLPLNASGKLDMKALQQQADANLQSTSSEGDQLSLKNNRLSSIEQTIAKVFADLLDVRQEQLTAASNFFALGGHSLLLTQLAARIRTDLHADVPLAKLYSSPTLAGMAELVRESTPEQYRPIERVSPRPQHVPLSYSMLRLLLHDLMHTGSTAYSVFIPIALRGRVDRAAFYRATRSFLRRHETLRTRIRESPSGEYYQHILHENDALEPMDRIIDVDEIVASGSTGGGVVPSALRFATVADLAAATAAERTVKFDVSSEAPLFRLAVLTSKTDPNAHMLIISLHHIVYDAWSHALLARELSALYQRSLKGIHDDGDGDGDDEDDDDDGLPYLSVAYADYSVWIRSRFDDGSSRASQSAIEFWAEQLRGVEPYLRLRGDVSVLSSPAADEHNGAMSFLTIEEGTTKDLLELAQREGCTLFHVLLSVFQVLLYRHSGGQESFAVGVPIAARSHVELEPLIGMFVNSLALPFRALHDGSGSGSGSGSGALKTFGDLLRGNVRTATQAFAHQDYPFDKVVEQLKIPRDASRNPLFQAQFNMLNFEHEGGSNFAQGLRLGSELAVEWADLSFTENVDSNFELNIYVTHDSDRGVIDLKLRYMRDIFSARAAQSLLEHFGQLCRSAIAGAE
jgi:aryl carrier-like protein